MPRGRQPRRQRGRDGREQIRARRRLECGPAFEAGSRRVAMLYPSPYRVGMSSLGFQWVLSRLRASGLAAERLFLPDDVRSVRRGRDALLSYETLTPLSSFPIIGISLAYELELEGMLRALDLAGIPLRREDRGPMDPVVLLGGPITFSNPLPAAPFVDAMLLGEADDTAATAFEAFFDCDGRDAWLDAVQALPGGFVPERAGVALPPIARASDEHLPARSLLWTPDTELSNMFLLEGERGCHRECTFCVMRRSTNGGMRLVSPERILSLIPEDAPRVGLVGAAISDHPKLVELLRTLVDSGRGIGVSSLRADQVARKPEIAALLRSSGARTLTVASDAASQRLRKEILKRTTEAHLISCAKLASEHGFETLKVYMMLGLPGETDADIEELVRFTRELGSIAPVALGVATFVPKRNTPLDGTPFADLRVVEARLDALARGLRGVAVVRPSSPRWAWVEYQLAQGGPEAGIRTWEAVVAGGRFADYRRAFSGAPDAHSERPFASTL